MMGDTTIAIQKEIPFQPLVKSCRTLVVVRPASFCCFRFSKSWLKNIPATITTNISSGLSQVIPVKRSSVKDFGEGSGVTGVVIAGKSQAPVKVISTPPANVRIVHKKPAR